MTSPIARSNQRITNLLVAGRCHSATQMAASLTHVTVTAMALDEAAGAAAALAATASRDIWTTSGVEVRAILEASGATVPAPEAVASGVAINPALEAFVKESGLWRTPDEPAHQ